MNHFEVITANRTWICPKTGVYKIIAVGGGSSAAMKFVSSSPDDTKSICIPGGITSFGNKLTAKGGTVYTETGYFQISRSSLQNPEGFGGAGGYNLQTYGGVGGFYIGSTLMPPTYNGGFLFLPGHGYGSGGAVGCLNTFVDVGNIRYTYWLKSSVSGELAEMILDIESGESIVCTIGSGGVLSHSNIAALFSSTSVTEEILKQRIMLADGKSGCIVVEYLGESL